MTQTDLAVAAESSTRHLSCLETGKAQPSREMVIRLSDYLNIPLRDRNTLLLAAGYAPAYGNRPLADGEMAPVRQALDRFLAAHEPYPAVVLDRLHNIVAANRAVQVLTEAVAPDLLEPPANALRIALHPEGLAPRTVNFDEWSGNLLRRLRGEVVVTGDGELSGCTRSLPATRTSTSIPGRRPFRRARTSSSRSASGPRPECSPSSAP